MSDGLEEVVQEFLVESYENLDQLDRDLVALEQDPTSQQILASVFRTIHTIKGTCGFLGFSRLEKVAHVGENLLARLRDGKLVLGAELTSALLGMFDAVRFMLTQIEETGQDGESDYPELIAQLSALLDAGTATPARGPAVATPPPAPSGLIGEEEPTPAPTPAAVIDDEPAPVEAAPEPAADPEPVAPASEARSAPPSSVTKSAAKAEPAAKSEGESKPNVADASIRVDVTLLDRLMNLVGELVLARNQILQYGAVATDPAFSATTQRLNLITTELQEGVMKTRMQPIGNIWNKFPRVVRDLSTACGKQIRLEMEGQETELDKTIIEAIKDPLTHILRNAADHGIEAPDARREAGKPVEGRLSLRAYHEGGQVNIEISEDGAGINVERVRDKAVQKGLITADYASRLSEREMQSLIFLPGLSTAEKVSNVSGRGVGMDVVKTNIEKIGGSVDVHSRLGEGTTFRIKIPLTLAIIPALMVKCGDDRYAIPQVSLLELVRLDGDQNGTIEQIHGTPVYRLRGRLLPLVYLDRELGVDSAPPVTGGGAVDDAVNIVVLQADDRQFGLVVDGICDTEEIVVKPLGKQLKGIDAFAGATIMGDGRVALILDVLGLAQRAGVVSERRDRALTDSAEHPTALQAQQTQTLLLFSLGDARRMAIPLSDVARLEEFPRTLVEHAGNRDVVQYRGQIMPLVALGEWLGAGCSEPDLDRPIQVVVFSRGERSVGMVVDRIVDIVEEAIVIEDKNPAAGTVGSAVVQHKVTDLLDLNGVVERFDPTWFQDDGATAHHAEGLIDG